MHFNQHSITFLGIHLRHSTYKIEKYTFINANIRVINIILKIIRDNRQTCSFFVGNSPSPIVREIRKNCKNLVPHDFRFDDSKLGYTCASAFLSSYQNTITMVSHQKGLVTCSRRSDYGDGAMRCEQENTASGWVRDCFPLSDPSPLAPLSERLAQATSQEAPRTLAHLSSPPLPPTPYQKEKRKVKKLIFEPVSAVAAKFRFLYQEAGFSRKSRNKFYSVWLAQFVKS